jgi:Zn-finger nucleic acid-binding protein
MISLVDPALPVDAHVERCKQCEGMWLNRGDLRRVKQRSLRHPNLQGETDAAPSVRAASGAAEWPTVGNLNDAMTPSHDDTDPSEDLQRDLLRGGAWVVVRLLLRWFIGL